MTRHQSLGAGILLLLTGGLAAGTVTRAQPPAERRPDDLGGDQEGSAATFGRLFRLPPFAEPTPAITAALARLGARGGPLDAGDDLAAGPVNLIVDPLLNLGNPNNDSQTAGVTFVGQFLDHDMTFDTTSRLGLPANPRRSPNARRPFFDLDSVYGDGPVGSPQLYDEQDRARFRVESGGIHEDVPRDAAGRAVIADPRNDENVVLAGLQSALLLVHNHALDLVRSERPGLDPEAAFAAARQLTTWHYQWMILHEFLPQIAGQAVVDAVLRDGRRFYLPRRGDAFIPVEFQLGYRIGHSMVRPSYRANFTGNGGGQFFAFVFDPAQDGALEPADLRGGVRAPRRFVGWTTFFRFPGFEVDVRPNKRIDTRLSTPLFTLPLGAIASGTPPVSLAERNLLRHLTWSVPSGQAIAASMGAPQLPAAVFGQAAAIHPSFATSTPLWYYLLAEAEVFAAGTRLGPVGARLVAEVFIGLLQSDPDGYLNAESPFTPRLGRSPGQFDMVDLLTFAGVGGRR